jgi:tetratricopeptide (TPR) repeat protein
MKKIIFLILSFVLLAGGWLGYSYYSFQIKFDEKISAQDWKSAKNLLDNWEGARTYWLLKNIPKIKQELVFEKGWLMSQWGDYEGALKEFRKAANISAPLMSQAIYNAATLALAGGRESLEKLAEDYIKVLSDNPDDFQAKVNLEIIRIYQKQAKMGMPPAPDEKGKKDKGKQKIKQFRPGEEENQGTESGDEGIRY